MIEGDWEGALLRLNGVTFHVDNNEEPSPGTLRVVKTRALVESFVALWEHHDFHPQRILELGTASGGAAALWFEHFQPHKLVTVDILEPPGGEFTRYRERAGERLRAYGGVDQADVARLHEIVAAEFKGPLDLVIDDASHMYEKTRASFDALFPLLRDGGFYMLEDWTWELQPKFQAPHPWADEKGLVQLVEELVSRVSNDVTRLVLEQNIAAVQKRSAAR